ncbi:3-hydroxyacyl-CoA dehydrogenase family protein [Arthrobacter sp. Br18]|uniref:3-hydroxyacyl-CoA dehydrogenase family protein n=1 Tax=Arthrobacter sp. Br18 TaxID=1312954 RepID=UPI0009DF2D1C
MKCVEVVRHEGTSQETVDTAFALAERLGKAPIVINREIPGFVANRLLGALRAEALKLYDGGYASFEDIDTAAKTALGHPMGPFELMDLVGLDVVYLIRQAHFQEAQDPADLPHPELEKLYESGHHGRKTGQGWYSYDD